MPTEDTENTDSKKGQIASNAVNESDEGLLNMTIIDDSEEVSTTTVESKEPEGRFGTETADLEVGKGDECTAKQNEEPQAEKAQVKNAGAIDKVAEADALIITADDVDLEMTDTQEKAPKERKREAASETVKQLPVEVPPKKDDFKVKEEVRIEEKESSPKKQVKSESLQRSAAHLRNSRFLWITNISKSTKANVLKQHFADYGKILTAKVVTDGKRCFGYLEFEKPSDAADCCKKCHETSFDGKTISLSLTRPETSSASKKKETKRGSSTTSSKVEVRVIKKRRSEDPLTTKFETVEEKKEDKDMLKEYLRETERLKRRVMEQEERQREERRRQRKREEEQRELEWKLKQERRRLQVERELFEKERKEVIRLDQERRKIEEEKLAILREKAKLEDELRNAKKVERKRKVSEEKEKEEEKRKKTMVKSKAESSFKKDDRYSKRQPDSIRAPPPPKLSEPIKLKPSRIYENRDRRRPSPNRPDEYQKIETIHRTYKPKIAPDRFDLKSRREYRRDSAERGFQQEQWKAQPPAAKQQRDAWMGSGDWKIGGPPAGAQRYEQGPSHQGYGNNYYYHHGSSTIGGAEYGRYEYPANRKY